MHYKIKNHFANDQVAIFIFWFVGQLLFPPLLRRSLANYLHGCSCEKFTFLNDKTYCILKCCNVNKRAIFSVYFHKLKNFYYYIFQCYLIISSIRKYHKKLDKFSNRRIKHFYFHKKWLADKTTKRCVFILWLKMLFFQHTCWYSMLIMLQLS